MEKGIIKKTCSFYFNEFHLTTILFPYVNEKIDEGVEICTLFEEDISSNMKTLVDNVMGNNKKNKEILNIRWEKALNILDKLNNIKNENVNIVIAGKKDYIIETNEIVKVWVSNKIHPKKIVINNCFRSDTIFDIQDVLAEHDLVLNTSGEIEKHIMFKTGKEEDKILT